jgi:hypothetical protein
MSLRLTAFALASSLVVAAATAWLLELSLGSIVLLAPVIVVGAGAVSALVVLWARALAATVRGRRG